MREIFTSFVVGLIFLGLFVYSIDNLKLIDEAKKFPKINKKINSIPIVKKNGQLIEKRKGIDQAHEVLAFHMPLINEKNRRSFFPRRKRRIIFGQKL
jgi:hypothetical protein